MTTAIWMRCLMSAKWAPRRKATRCLDRTLRPAAERAENCLLRLCRNRPLPDNYPQKTPGEISPGVFH